LISVEGLTSVKVQSLDDQHANCAAVLNTLLVDRTSTALAVVHRCLKNHFQHEEALLAQHSWGGLLTDPFSARKSHIADHKRLLALIETHIGSMASTLPPSFVKEVADGFVQHTELFDTHYADELALGRAR
jgi:hemerythrin